MLPYQPLIANLIKEIRFYIQVHAGSVKKKLSGSGFHNKKDPDSQHRSIFYLMLPYRAHIIKGSGFTSPRYFLCYPDPYDKKDPVPHYEKDPDP